MASKSSMLALIEETMTPPGNGREVVHISRNSQRALATYIEQMDTKMVLIREAAMALEDLYKQASWKCMEVEAHHQVLLQLVPDDLAPEDEAILAHLKRQCQMALVTLSDEAQQEIVKLVLRS